MVDYFAIPLDFVIKFIIKCDKNWKEFEVEEFDGPFTTAVVEPGEIRAKLEDVPKIVELADYVFAELGVTLDHRSKMYKHWLAHDPNAILFIDDIKQPEDSPHRRIGYTSVLSLKNDAYEMYRRGELSEYKLNKEHFAAYSSDNPARFIFIQALAAVGGIDRDLWKVVYHTIACHVALHNSHPKVAPPIIIVDACYKSGAKLAKKWGFAQIGQSADNTPLFELNFGDYNKLDLAGKCSVDLIDMVSAVYREKIDALARVP